MPRQSYEHSVFSLAAFGQSERRQFENVARHSLQSPRVTLGSSMLCTPETLRAARHAERLYAFLAKLATGEQLGDILEGYKVMRPHVVEVNPYDGSNTPRPLIVVALASMQGAPVEAVNYRTRTLAREAVEQMSPQQMYQLYVD